MTDQVAMCDELNVFLSEGFGQVQKDHVPF